MAHRASDKKRNDFMHEGKGKGVLDIEAAAARQIAAHLLWPKSDEIEFVKLGERDANACVRVL
jgi:hypothetical protein